MYPLNVHNKVVGGYAVASDENEHKRLSESGYEPAFVGELEADPGESDSDGHTVESARATLDAAGISYDKRLGLARLLELLPK